MEMVYRWSKFYWENIRENMWIFQPWTDLVEELVSCEFDPQRVFDTIPSQK
jgi:hypothetical protein